ncbi:MAG: ribose ABC transporter permease [Anaeromyxobacter sp.]
MSRARWRELLSAYGIQLAFVALVIVLAVLSPSFRDVGNVITIFRQIAVIAVLAFGMTVVVLTAGIDLSVGSMLALSGAVAAGLAAQAGWPPALAIAAALAVGLLLGLHNGFFAGVIGVAPFIATLGGLTIFRGLALVYTGGRPITGLPDAFTTIGSSAWLGLPSPIWVMLGFLLVTHLILRYTALGRAIYAVGGNEEAARLSGLPVTKVKLFAYAYCGLASAVGALVLTGRLNSAQPTAGVGFELDAIAAVVVGGTSLFGGKGGVLGTLLGAAILGVLNNGMNLMNVDPFFQGIAKGYVILGAVTLERLVSTKKN